MFVLTWFWFCLRFVVLVWWVCFFFLLPVQSDFCDLSLIVLHSPICLSQILQKLSPCSFLTFVLWQSLMLFSLASDMQLLSVAQLILYVVMLFTSREEMSHLQFSEQCAIVQNIQCKVMLCMFFCNGFYRDLSGFNLSIYSSQLFLLKQHSPKCCVCDFAQESLFARMALE